MRGNSHARRVLFLWVKIDMVYAASAAAFEFVPAANVPSNNR